MFALRLVSESVSRRSTTSFQKAAFSTSVSRFQDFPKSSKSLLFSSILESKNSSSSSSSVVFTTPPRATDATAALDAPLSYTVIPRTGVYAGRTVEVLSESDLSRALRRLNTMNSINRVRQTSMEQTKYVRPGKVKQRILIERKKRKYNQNVKRMFELVAEARRKGY
ncbi:mitochondrial 37S ribosomal protein bS21m [Magnusiomyces paraingens]|uniref:Ribosomal protein S21 n=1 Tax=Magnusiomyces paraingens TaxID=2606893 RepID=A0A5E8B8L6_9ASCO|nr:uncharacterized protein SAPINGB_P000811 [Saprochaete ingens]VVT45607.1 unnamed protein product [Saprochaete ingens]